MRISRQAGVMLAIAIGAYSVAARSAAQAPQQHDHAPAQQHDPAAHTHAEAAKLKNPVRPDTASLAAGRQLYAANCVECHGDTGRGDGPKAADFDPKPANLADAQWKHGSSDGEMFTAIRDGIRNSGMSAFGRKLNDQQMWQIVNYMRSIGPSQARPRRFE